MIDGLETFLKGKQFEPQEIYIDELNNQVYEFSRDKERLIFVFSKQVQVLSYINEKFETETFQTIDQTGILQYLNRLVTQNPV